MAEPWADVERNTDGMTQPFDRRLYEQGWCPSPVIVDGHKIKCSLGDYHDGEHVATKRDVAEHVRGGKKACERNGCGRE